MRRRRYEPRGPRTVGSRGFVVLVGGRTAIAPPDLKPGQVHCRVCRQATTLTSTGIYRRHCDLFGNPCGARSPQASVRLEAVPDVVIPDERKTVDATAQRPPQASKGPRAHGACQDCDAFVSGERRYCGKCAARHERERRRKG